MEGAARSTVPHSAEKRETIRRAADAGVTLITICNYEKFQTQTAAQAASDAPTTRRRRAGDAKENKGNKGNKESPYGDSIGELALPGFDLVPVEPGLPAKKAKAGDPIDILAEAVGRPLAEEFAEMRKAIKKPVTPGAATHRQRPAQAARPHRRD